VGENVSLDASDYTVKLVRDKMRSKLGGGTMRYAVALDHEEHVKLLRAKLIEEATEYLLDPSPEELGDVMQVVHDLAFVDLNLGLGDLEGVRLDKSVERGGFREGIVMLATVSEGDGSEG
jgi:predicted house-cleaning noncanonical NTP pyrophosphatase (MazG superfamily)